MDFSQSFTTGFSLAAGATGVNGTAFTSAVVSIPKQAHAGSITVTFTPAGGSASTVQFYFQVSHDKGATWTNYVDPVTGLEYIAVATNHAAIGSGVIAVTRWLDLRGFDSIQLASVVNNDATNALTAVNASIGFNIV